MDCMIWKIKNKTTLGAKGQKSELKGKNKWYYLMQKPG